jgi:hypothetical protein
MRKVWIETALNGSWGRALSSGWTLDGSIHQARRTPLNPHPVKIDFSASRCSMM